MFQRLPFNQNTWAMSRYVSLNVLTSVPQYDSFANWIKFTKRKFSIEVYYFLHQHVYEIFENNPVNSPEALALDLFDIRLEYNGLFDYPILAHEIQRQLNFALISVDELIGMMEDNDSRFELYCELIDKSLFKVEFLINFQVLMEQYVKNPTRYFQSRREAFAMGGHSRLGADSVLRRMDVVTNSDIAVRFFEC